MSELQTPPTEAEISDVLLCLRALGASKLVDSVRRLAFNRDVIKSALAEAIIQRDQFAKWHEDATAARRRQEEENVALRQRVDRAEAEQGELQKTIERIERDHRAVELLRSKRVRQVFFGAASKTWRSSTSLPGGPADVMCNDPADAIIAAAAKAGGE